jgi:hypothetical protein
MLGKVHATPLISVAQVDATSFIFSLQLMVL